MRKSSPEHEAGVRIGRFVSKPDVSANFRYVPVSAVTA